MRYLIGVGNYMMGDDAVGLKVAEEVARKGLNDGFEVLELADSGLNLIHYLNAETERILIVDAVPNGRNPGEYSFFRPEAVETRKIDGRMTTHEGDILKVIGLARSLGQGIPPIEIMGIEPGRMEPGLDLSENLRGELDRYIEAAIQRMTGITAP